MALIPILWIVLAVLVGYWNNQRGHPFWVGFVASLFLSPIIGGIIVVATKPKATENIEE